MLIKTLTGIIQQALNYMINANPTISLREYEKSIGLTNESDLANYRTVVLTQGEEFYIDVIPNGGTDITLVHDTELLDFVSKEANRYTYTIKEPQELASINAAFTILYKDGLGADRTKGPIGLSISLPYNSTLGYNSVSAREEGIITSLPHTIEITGLDDLTEVNSIIVTCGAYSEPIDWLDVDNRLLYLQPKHIDCNTEMVYIIFRRLDGSIFDITSIPHEEINVPNILPHPVNLDESNPRFFGDLENDTGSNRSYILTIKGGQVSSLDFCNGTVINYASSDIATDAEHIDITSTRKVIPSNGESTPVLSVTIADSAPFTTKRYTNYIDVMFENRNMGESDVVMSMAVDIVNLDLIEATTLTLDYDGPSSDFVNGIIKGSVNINEANLYTGFIIRHKLAPEDVVVSYTGGDVVGSVDFVFDSVDESGYTDYELIMYSDSSVIETRTFRATVNHNRIQCITGEIPAKLIYTPFMNDDIRNRYVVINKPAIDDPDKVCHFKVYLDRTAIAGYSVSSVSMTGDAVLSYTDIIDGNGDLIGWDVVTARPNDNWFKYNKLNCYVELDPDGDAPLEPRKLSNKYSVYVVSVIDDVSYRTTPRYNAGTLPSIVTDYPSIGYAVYRYLGETHSLNYDAATGAISKSPVVPIDSFGFRYTPATLGYHDMQMIRMMKNGEVRKYSAIEFYQVPTPALPVAHPDNSIPGIRYTALNQDATRAEGPNNLMKITIPHIPDATVTYEGTTLFQNITKLPNETIRGNEREVMTVELPTQTMPAGEVSFLDFKYNSPEFARGPMTLRKASLFYINPDKVQPIDFTVKEGLDASTFTTLPVTISITGLDENIAGNYDVYIIIDDSTTIQARTLPNQPVNDVELTNITEPGTYEVKVIQQLQDREVTSVTKTITSEAPTSGMSFINYYPSWKTSWFNPSNAVEPSHLRMANTPNYFTDLMIAFASTKLSFDKTTPTLVGSGIQGYDIMTDSALALKDDVEKAQAKGMRVLISIGGATYGRPQVPDAWQAMYNESVDVMDNGLSRISRANTPVMMSYIEMMEYFNLDGIDLDFEDDPAWWDSSPLSGTRWDKYLDAYYHLLHFVSVAASEAGTRLDKTMYRGTACWSTGWHATAATNADSATPNPSHGLTSYWGGMAGRERAVFGGFTHPVKGPINARAFIDKFISMSYDFGPGGTYANTTADVSGRPVVPGTVVDSTGEINANGAMLVAAINGTTADLISLGSVMLARTEWQTANQGENIVAGRDYYASSIYGFITDQPEEGIHYLGRAVSDREMMVDGGLTESVMYDPINVYKEMREIITDVNKVCTVGICPEPFGWQGAGSKMMVKSADCMPLEINHRTRLAKDGYQRDINLPFSVESLAERFLTVKGSNAKDGFILWSGYKPAGTYQFDGTLSANATTSSIEVARVLDLPGKDDTTVIHV